MQVIQIRGWVQKNIAKSHDFLQPFLEYATIPPAAIFKLQLPNLHTFSLIRSFKAS